MRFDGKIMGYTGKPWPSTVFSAICAGPSHRRIVDQTNSSETMENLENIKLVQ